jgi:hypothetical protein
MFFDGSISPTRDGKFQNGFDPDASQSGIFPIGSSDVLKKNLLFACTDEGSDMSIFSQPWNAHVVNASLAPLAAAFVAKPYHRLLSELKPVDSTL